MPTDLNWPPQKTPTHRVRLVYSGDTQDLDACSHMGLSLLTSPTRTLSWKHKVATRQQAVLAPLHLLQGPRISIRCRCGIPELAKSQKLVLQRPSGQITFDNREASHFCSSCAPRAVLSRNGQGINSKTCPCVGQVSHFFGGLIILFKFDPRRKIGHSVVYKLMT